VFIADDPDNAGSRRTRRRRARFRVGCEARISHLKRNYGAGRSRLKGTNGAKIWESWSVLAYDLDTLARLPIAATQADPARAQPPPQTNPETRQPASEPGSHPPRSTASEGSLLIRGK
jgi:hypothetical protein